ncbi:DUF6668 family protein [Intrasporangium sp.]|uniref:DUF6668 family protein n=1 Tax=Intrasporangium sp. TaxID=1925024 RepID=UPI0034642B55
MAAPRAQARNPWLPPLAAEPLTIPVEAPRERSAGPGSPQRGVPAPDTADQLPLRDVPAGSTLWVVGAHGGAGETTVAALHDQWLPAGRSWPRRSDGAPVCAVLVCRSHHAGLRAAQKAIVQWASGLTPGLQLVGLVVLPDAPGKLPRELRDLIRLLQGGVPRVWELPWVPEWRIHPCGDYVPGRVAQVVTQLEAAARASDKQ